MTKVKVLISGRIENIREVTRQLYPMIGKIEYTTSSKEAQLIIAAHMFDKKKAFEQIEAIFYKQNKRVII